MRRGPDRRAGRNAVAVLSHGRALVEAIASATANGQGGGITAIVDALFEQDAFAGLTTSHRQRPQKRLSPT